MSDQAPPPHRPTSQAQALGRPDHNPFWTILMGIMAVSSLFKTQVAKLCLTGGKKKKSPGSGHKIPPIPELAPRIRAQNPTNQGHLEKLHPQETLKTAFLLSSLLLLT